MRRTPPLGLKPVMQAIMAAVILGLGVKAYAARQVSAADAQAAARHVFLIVLENKSFSVTLAA